MARKRFASPQDEAEVDMTPMLDIVFIMLIFFIVTTSFVKEKGLDINRPKQTVSNPKDKKKSLVIKINDDGSIWMDNRMVDVERVALNIESFLSENMVSMAVINAEPNVEHQVVVSVIDQIHGAGLQASIASKL